MASSNSRTPRPDTNVIPKLNGTVSDAGPYEAIVVGHVKGNRMGQLLVHITDWQGAIVDVGGVNPDAIPASYASPFYGTTYGTDTQQLPDGPVTSGQSYGFWFVPPDVGNKVLVTFVGGDISRCYWFACIYDTTSHHMVPGIARAIGGTNDTIVPAGDSISEYLSGDSILPVVEFDTGVSAKTAFNADGLENTLRYIHEYQSVKYASQGLDRDPIRGAISSSSMREAPSNVYGISTPGRKGTAGDQVAGRPSIVVFRQGGHQFVMDDGDEDGNDQLVRLRTAGGHQILMNDKEHVLYIASDTGQQWLEFSPNGQINVYGAGGFNVRTKGPMNFHSDSTIKMNAMSFDVNATLGISFKTFGSFSASAVTSASVSANGKLSLTGLGMASLTAGAKLDISSLGDTNIVGTILRLNSGKPSIPFPALPAIPKSYPDVEYDGKKWVVSSAVSSICTVVPTHEPWKRPTK